MPSAASPTPVTSAVVVATATIDLRMLQPTFPRTYPKAAPLGMLIIALAYFSLGVAVGGLMKQSSRARRWLPVLIIPGLLGAIVFLAWVIRSLL
jgi:amino acid transporter